MVAVAWAGGLWAGRVLESARTSRQYLSIVASYFRTDWAYTISYRKERPCPKPATPLLPDVIREIGVFSSMNDSGAAATTHVLTIEEIAKLAADAGKPAETLANVVALIADRFKTDVCSA